MICSMMISTLIMFIGLSLTNAAYIHLDGLPDRIFYQKGDLDIASVFGYTEYSDSGLCGIDTEAWTIAYFESVR